MFECFMKDIIHESIFDICNNIYDDICYNNNNCHDNKDILNQDLNNFIENGINKLSVYDINNILLSYGIDNAYNYYVENMYNEMYSLCANDTKNKLLSIMSHDLRAPFATMSNALKYMTMEDSTLTEEEKKMLLQKTTESLGSVAEIYTILLIVFPLLAVIMLSIMGIMSPSLGGFDLLTLMNILTFAVIPLSGVLMLVMMDTMVPKR